MLNESWGSFIGSPAVFSTSKYVYIYIYIYIYSVTSALRLKFLLAFFKCALYRICLNPPDIILLYFLCFCRKMAVSKFHQHKQWSRVSMVVLKDVEGGMGIREASIQTL